MLIAYLLNNYKTITKRERDIYSRIVRRYLITSLEISIIDASVYSRIIRRYLITNLKIFAIDTSNLSTILMLHLFNRLENLNYLIHYSIV